MWKHQTDKYVLEMTFSAFGSICDEIFFTGRPLSVAILPRLARLGALATVSENLNLFSSSERKKAGQISTQMDSRMRLVGCPLSAV